MARGLVLHGCAVELSPPPIHPTHAAKISFQTHCSCYVIPLSKASVPHPSLMITGCVRHPRGSTPSARRPTVFTHRRGSGERKRSLQYERHTSLTRAPLSFTLLSARNAQFNLPPGLPHLNSHTLQVQAYQKCHLVYNDFLIPDCFFP